MNTAVLSVRGLRVEFPGLGYTVQAVRDCDLEVGAGEVLGLVGESGCGKSVTALACLGLVPAPGHASGSIKLCGHEVIGNTERALGELRGGTAAMIFQNPNAALNPFFTVGHQLTHPIRLHRGLRRAAARAAAVEALQAVRLSDPELALDRYPHQLSGGQLQRVMIAMAIASRPRLLIADEPTTALDVTVQAQIIVLLRELAASTGLTVLFITHDLGVVATLCDRVAVMYAGTVVEQGPVGAVIGSPAHPYTGKLLGAVPKIGQGRGELASIPGQVPNLAAPPSGCAFHPRCERASSSCEQRRPAPHAVEGPHLAACHHPLAPTAAAAGAR